MTFATQARTAPRIVLLITALTLHLIGASPAGSQALSEKILPLDGHFGQDGTVFELNWFDAKPPRVGSVTVNRRLYGQQGAQSWVPIAPPLGPVLRYTDRDVKPGVAYEYQVLRTARDIVDVGYWVAGTDLPAIAERGILYLVVDETISDALAPRLARFERDLIGDGWQVRRHTAPREDSSDPVKILKQAADLKTWLYEHFSADPFNRHAVVLVGRLPLVRSGRANPDGHEPAAHGSDLFYADMDGRWTATPDGKVLDNQVPGNFIEMQIGRIDFQSITRNRPDAEIHHLRAYFDKNHHWRHGLLGDLREAYGNPGHLDVEKAALRNIVGANAVTTGGHHDVGEEKPWLWGVDFGDWNAAAYAEKYTNKAVFAINFGSGKQQIGYRDNQMVALLAQPWYTLAVGWGARPAWWLHHMALGGSIGEVHMRTVNNGQAAAPYRRSMDYFPTGAYLFRNPVWVNLLGDPTLRAFPLQPPSALTLEPSPEGNRLRWAASPDPDTLGYRVYRASAQKGVFTEISGKAPVTGLSFTDESGTADQIYMVRAYGLKDVYAGSFFTLSQGVFAARNTLPAADAPPDLDISTPAGEAVALPPVFSQVTDGRIHAIIDGPVLGRIRHDGTDWIYTPPTGFTGTVTLRFSVSDVSRTTQGRLSITVTPRQNP